MLRSKRKWLIGAALVGGVAAGGWSLLEGWRGQDPPQGDGTATTSDAEATPSNKVIVGEQAQRNLKLTAKPLKADVFWKSIDLPGIVVDRPGVSDREIVAPAIGIVTQMLHVPGDIVHAGDLLFTLKLASESLLQTQSDLYKATQDIRLAEARKKRLEAAAGGIAQARVIDVQDEIARFEVAVKAARQELLGRGLSREDVDGIATGKLLSEIAVVVPPHVAGAVALVSAPGSKSMRTTANDRPPTYQVQELKVELGQQVQAGQTLCHLSNHQSLAIEGRAFRDETALLERSIQSRSPVEVDFQEAANTDWTPIEQTFTIQYIASTIDPVTRTFSFLMPLENQSKTIDQCDRPRLLWRFRTGQKVRLRVRVEKLEGVFVLPADAVVLEGAEAFVFTQNVNTFERRGVHVLHRDRDRVVIANDGSLPTYVNGNERWTISAVSRTAAAQLNRMTKAGSSGVPKGFHVHADGSLHKNEDEGK